MRRPSYSRQFERDVKLQRRRGKDTGKLRAVLQLLVEERPFAEKHRDHSLSGDFSGYRECHIESDWLLIYRIEEKTVYFVRTGTHSDLFG